MKAHVAETVNCCPFPRLLTLELSLRRGVEGSLSLLSYWKDCRCDGSYLNLSHQNGIGVQMWDARDRSDTRWSQRLRILSETTSPPYTPYCLQVNFFNYGIKWLLKWLFIRNPDIKINRMLSLCLSHTHNIQ